MYIKSTWKIKTHQAFSILETQVSWLFSNTNKLINKTRRISKNAK